MYTQTALTSADSYKLGHADQYPENTEFVYSNFTPRSMAHFKVPVEFKPEGIVWVGMRAFLSSFAHIWQVTFFDRPVDEVVQEFSMFCAPFCGPNGFNTARLRKLHALGYLPIKIKSLPEGSIVPMGVPAMTVINTVKGFGWLTNFIETWISAELWKTSTSATIVLTYRRILNKYVELTGGSAEFADWQIHDFSPRGMSGIQDAARTGFGHLVCSLGTDNLPAVKFAIDCYDGADTFVGGSVPATEHSVMCAGGKEAEIETFRRLLKTYPSGVLSIVSDTWNFWKVIGPMAEMLKPEIEARTPDSQGLAKVVFRPDSGDPVKIICGDPDAEPGSPQYKGAVQCLWETFGGTRNSMGYKTLNQRVGLIYGDSITLEREGAILAQLALRGFASDNIVFGVGSYTYQYLTRDTFGFAMKATYVVINGVGQEIFKDPITDSGVKKSARGLLRVDYVNGVLKLTDQVSWDEETGGELSVVFQDGLIYSTETLKGIRARVAERM
jgi:nicotinamide phosphoribosyltransferase